VENKGASLEKVDVAMKSGEEGIEESQGSSSLAEIKVHKNAHNENQYLNNARMSL